MPSRAGADGQRHVVAVRPLYGGSDHLLASGLLGTSVSWVAAEAVSAAVRPDTGLVVVETPANPTLQLVDLGKIRQQAGTVPLLVDNTFATPVLQQPVRHGADLVLHSATKFIGGHGDVLGGVVACGPAWAARLRKPCRERDCRCLASKLDSSRCFPTPSHIAGIIFPPARSRPPTCRTGNRLAAVCPTTQRRACSKAPRLPSSTR